MSTNATAAETEFEVIYNPLLGDEQAELNDAYVSGTDSPEWRALLDRPMTFLLPADLKKDAKQKVWTNTTAPLREWLIGGPNGAFSMQPEKKAKGYFPVVFGQAAGNSRSVNSMVTQEALTLDIDSGDKYDDAIQRVAALGIAAVGYASFNDQSETSGVVKDAVIKFMDKAGRGGEITSVDVQDYMTASGKFHPDHIKTVTFTGKTDHTDRGVELLVEHAPLDKFRLICWLEAPVHPGKICRTHREGLALYKSKLLGLAEMLELRIDESCVDVSRAFYMPSRKKGTTPVLDILRGKPIKFSDLPDGGSSRKNPFEIAGAARKEVATSDGLNLKKWAVTHGARLEITSLIEAEAPDRVRQDKGGLLVVECPFSGDHGADRGQEDTGCHVRDADGDVGFVWQCKHDSCGDHDRLDMLREAINLGWFDASAITNDSYLVPLADQDLPAVEGRFEPVKDWLPDRYRVKGDTIYLIGSGKEDPDRPLCQFFNVLGRGSNVVGDDGASRIIVFKNLNGVEVEIELNRADLYGDGAKGVIDRLAAAEMGLFVRDNRSKCLLLDLLAQITPKRRIPTSPRLGWTKDPAGRVLGFMCPTGEYIAVDPAQPMRLHADATIQYRQKFGTLEGWKAAASAAINVTENFYWGVGVAAGFVGPVMGLIGGEPCGMFLAGATSKGKSEALRLAVSVWATPHEKRGLFFTLNTTANAIEDLATLGSGTVAAFDEVGAMQNLRDLPAILFGLSTGAGKSRKRGRGAGLDDGAEFQPFILLTNERPLKASVEGAGGTYKDGLSVRFPTVDVTGGVKVAGATMDKIAGCASNFGHAGPEFVRYLIAQGYHTNPDVLRARYAELVAEIVGDGADAPMKRAGRAFGLVALAGELAKEAGLLDGDILPGVIAAFETFKGADEGRNVSGDDGILSGFRSWLVGEMGVSVVPANEATERRNRPVVGWHTASHFILDWEKLRDLDRLGINGTRSALVQALKVIGAIEMSGKNNYHNALPAEVEFEESTGSGRLANLRILRDKLGL